MSTDNPPEIQRAIVLQGGGALGAYDAGVLRALCSRIQEIDDENTKKNVFDILAGTSSGAINASIISGFVTNQVEKARTEKKEPDFVMIWNAAIDRLYEFWRYISVVADVEKDPTFKERWRIYRKFNPSAASPEAARRWYATSQFLQYGAPNAFNSPIEIRDEKFFDRFNTWYLYDNSRLRDSVKKYGHFPIASGIDRQHPRLLMVSVDVREGTHVVFDSYEKSPGIRFSRCGEPGSINHISYDEGITEDHVIASASVPVNYGYTKVQDSTNTVRYLWDGGWLSNTPLRELISEHQEFWTTRIGNNSLESDMWKYSGERPRKVPDLRVYITNVWPKVIARIPRDHDRVVERSKDMIFLDKTDYEEKIATLVDDYISLIKDMRRLGHENARDKSSFDDALTRLMEDYTSTSKCYQEIKRRNKDIVKGRFDVRVHRIQLTDDEESTSRKFFDFSHNTIERLLQKGYEDGLNQFKDILS
jgi:NTE family protein